MAALLFALPYAAFAQSTDDHAGMVHRTSLPASERETANASIEATRKATLKFADRRVAIAAGYRRVGMDFPSMGEHWINPAVLVAGTFDPRSPAVLTYATVNGHPRLLGVVYAAVLAPNESPPSFAGRGAVWHEHNGSIDEESLLPEHAGHDHTGRATGSSQTTRLAILHAWTIVPNPAGMFVAENWALPFIRNGLSVPSVIPISAARELALVSGGEEYYRRLFSVNADDSGPFASRREADIQLAITGGRKIVEGRKKPEQLSADELSALAAIWDRFAAAINPK